MRRQADVLLLFKMRTLFFALSASLTVWISDRTSSLTERGEFVTRQTR
jgi:hypothetical protein